MKRLVTVAAVTGLGLAGLGSAAASADQGAAKPTASKLAWHACPADIVKQVSATDTPQAQGSKRIKCAELSVPLDYAHPNGTKITLEVTLTPHTGAGKAMGQMVVNPGGPGGSGAYFGGRVFNQSSKAMQDAYDFVGFDPRGIGHSVPAIRCDLKYQLEPRPDYGTGDPKSEKTWLGLTKRYAEACGKADKVGLLSHDKTVDSARDVESIRKALGSRKLDYHGASYGTYLGQVYAALFPDKVGRMALDGNIGPSGVWYDANLQQDIWFDRNIDYFFGWLAKWDKVYHLGTTQKQVRAWFYDLRAKLAKNPVFVKDPQSGDVTAVTSDSLTDNIQNAGYRRLPSYWFPPANGLAAYKKGDMAGFADAFGGPTTGESDDNSYFGYSAVQCTDVQWPTNWAKWQRDNTRINRKHPFLTWGNAWYNTPCLYWPAKPGTPVDVRHVKKLPTNIMMFNAANDAATPYPGALELHRALKGSRMLVESDGRTHCIVHRGNPAVDAVWDTYFLTGKRPAKGLTFVKSTGDPVPPANALTGTSVKGLGLDIAK
ncbi:alpha/beta hydrolase [Actinomadura rupiterrae]|uniref:alpha/beta hydrolase n=1 Tax=Actinomadura rupiterrae TaxID=559627 RepID=UPI0020A3FABC|nr:alpha/beta hydrolase [Actinomadura rupiterrae]MCP2339655.1 pimeloyl-ACP methyl ester carboxylesterase [Actinomadura rupiterrae]